MPHSSGGGSHGGGSHGGSHHSSSHGGGGRSSRSTTSKTPFPGARRYRYRRFGRYHYYYSAEKNGKVFHPARLLLGFVYLPFLLPLGGVLLSQSRAFFMPKNSTIVIKDEANVLSDDSALEKSLEAFADKTHITPAVITVNNNVWQNSYSSLEKYAYNRYLDEFDDENHWLIIYSEPQVHTSDFVEWYWEGMQGDNTDAILTTSVTGQFNSDLQRHLEQNEDIAGSIAASFDTATAAAKRPGLRQWASQTAPVLFALAFVCFHAYFMLGLYELKYIGAEPDPDEPDPVPDPTAVNRFTTNDPFAARQQFATMQQSGMQPQFGMQPQQFGAQQPQFGTQPQQFGAQPAVMQPLETPQSAVMQPLEAPQTNAAAQQSFFDTQPGFGTQQSFLNPQPPVMQQAVMQTLEAQQQQMQDAMQSLESITNPAMPTADRFMQLPPEPTLPPQPTYPQSVQSPYPQTPQSAYPQAQAPAYPQTQQPAYPQTQQPAQPQAPAEQEETCPYCGTKHFKGVKYCPGCGIEFTSITGSTPFR